MRYLLALTLLTLLLTPVLAQPVGKRIEPVDCSNLLIILERILESAVSGVPNLELVSTVASASIPGNLGVGHRDAYGKLLRYFEYLERASGGNLSPREASGLAVSISIFAKELQNAVHGYKETLVACSHDPTLAATLSVRIGQLLGKLTAEYLPAIAYLLLSQTSGGLLEVRLGRGVYRAGELAELVVRPLREGVEVLRAYVALWPSLTRVTDVTLVKGGLEYVGRFQVPNLTTLSRYYPSTPITVALVAITEVLDPLSNSTYRGYALFSVNFDYPRVVVEAPSTLYLGEVLEVVVRSDNFYRARVGVGGSYALNTTLVPGVNTFRFDTSLLSLTYGTYLIRVEVEPTEESVGLVITRPVVILPRVSRVEVRVPTFLVTVDGYVTIEVVSKEVAPAQLRAVISVGGTVRGSYYFNESLRVRVPLSYLPISSTEVSVTVVPESLGYEPYVARGVVVCVNPATSIAVGIASVLATALLHGREREFTLLLRSLSRRRLTGVTRAVRSAVLEFSYRVSSRIAELYYGTLRRLRLPMPEPYETLREHLSRLSLGQRLRELLWRFMLVVERDLYSSRRQDYGEALGVAEEVLRSGR